ncbi:hypothetical protein ACXYRQ_01255 [Mycoplasma sp. 394]
MLDKNIKLFKLYKMKEKLSFSLDNFNKQQTKYLLPILYIGDDIIFGEVRAQDKTKILETTNLYNDKNKKSNLALYYKNFYRMNSKILKEYIYEDEQTISLGHVSAVNELNILDKLKYCFSKEDTNTKLTYIYPKKNEEENLEESKAKEIKISEKQEFLKHLNIKEPILYDPITGKEDPINFFWSKDRNEIIKNLYSMLNETLKTGGWLSEKELNNLSWKEFQYETDAKLERLNNLDWDELADYYSDPKNIHHMMIENNVNQIWTIDEFKLNVKNKIKEEGLKSNYLKFLPELMELKDKTKFVEIIESDENVYLNQYDYDEMTNELIENHLNPKKEFNFIVNNDNFNIDYLNKQEQEDNEKLEKLMEM